MRERERVVMREEEGEGDGGGGQRHGGGSIVAGNGEVELVHDGDVGGQHGDHVASIDVDRRDGGSKSKALTVGVGPGVGYGVVYDERAIIIDNGSSFKEAERSERAQIGIPGLQ